jgi:Xaa-Pro aminopeptidase
MRYEVNRYGVEGTVTGGYDGWARVLKPGDVFNTELFGYCGNIQGQVQACACIGEPSRLVERLAETARESYEAGLKVLRPGTTWGELGLAMEMPTFRRGFWHPTPVCHMLNPENDFSYINIGIEGTSGLPGFKARFFRERDMPAHQDSTGFKRADRVLQPGNTIEFEPNATFYRERVNIGGNVLVTKDGCEELNPGTSLMRIVRA